MHGNCGEHSRQTFNKEEKGKISGRKIVKIEKKTANVIQV